jgi:hypothetical protein
VAPLSQQPWLHLSTAAADKGRGGVWAGVPVARSGEVVPGIGATALVTSSGGDEGDKSGDIFVWERWAGGPMGHRIAIHPTAKHPEDEVARSSRGTPTFS